MNPRQEEFLFADGPVPEFHPTHPLGDFIAEVAARWSLPLGRTVRVDLAGDSVTEIRGCLELAVAPDLPLDSRQPLTLRIGAVVFSSRQITAWREADT